LKLIKSAPTCNQVQSDRQIQNDQSGVEFIGSHSCL
jgi:hypothetical protein